MRGTDDRRETGKAGGKAAEGREARLAEALRANLRRRKAQAKARAGSTDPREDERPEKGAAPE